MDDDQNDTLQEVEQPPETLRDPSGNLAPARERPSPKIGAVQLQQGPSGMSKMAAEGVGGNNPVNWGNFRIPKKSKEIQGMSSSSDELSDDEEGVPHRRGAKRSIAATWTPMAAGVTIEDDSIYDPLSNKTPEVELENSQWAFLLKYFKDPQFSPELLDALEADAPIPEILNQWVRRPMDQEILDLMPQNAQDWAVQQDKAFLSVSARLGTALGPLIQLWN